MKKWMFSLALLTTFSLTSNADFQNMVEHDHAYPVRSFASHESQYLRPDSVATKYLTVKGMQIDKFDKTSRAKLEEAFVVLEQVVNSEEFKERIINFKNSAGMRAFASSKGLTNEEIYEKFMEGRETLQQNTPGEMNFYLKLYNRSWSRVIGFTNPKTNLININWKYFKNYGPQEVAGNLAHEWTHKIGFDHASAKEHDSAPYAIGYIVEEMGQQYLKGRELY